MTIRILVVLILIFSSKVYSQIPIAEMPLPEVPRDGFYKIEIPVKYSGYFAENYSNLRISDGSKYEVPFITGREIEEARSQFRSYEILSKEQRKGCCTQLIFRGDGKINNIRLRIRNAETSKHASLLGSDDQESWFVLKERFHLSYVDGRDNTSEMRIVDFPLSNYQFYKIQIDDSLTAPLSILEVGSYDHNPERRTFGPISDAKIRISHPNSGKTLVEMDWDTLQRIDRLAIYVSGPPLFHRHAELYAVAADRRPGKPSRNRWLGSIELSNAQAAIVDLTAPLTTNIELLIEDHDSPPLQIDSIKGFQVKRFLLAHLQHGKPNRIVVHDKAMRAPVYDLQSFRNKITGEMEILQPGHLIKAGESDQKEILSSELMWGAILLIIAVLGFYSYRMVRSSEVS